MYAHLTVQAITWSHFHNEKLPVLLSNPHDYLMLWVQEDHTGGDKGTAGTGFATISSNFLNNSIPG